MLRTVFEIINLSQMAFMTMGVVFYFITPVEKRRAVFEIGWILILGLAADIGGLLMYYLKMPTSNLWNNVYMTLSTLLWLQFFRRRIENDKINSAVLWIGFGLVVLLLANIIFVPGPIAMNSHSNTIDAIVVFVIATYYLWTLIREGVRQLWLLYNFWLSAATVLMYATITLYFLLFDYFVSVRKSDMVVETLILHSTQLIFYWMIWIALWLNRNQKKQ